MYSSKSVTITPNDSTPLANIPIGIAVSVEGSYNLQLLNDATVKAHYLAAGIIHPLRVKIVQATGLPSGAVVIGYYQ